MENREDKINQLMTSLKEFPLGMLIAVIGTILSGWVISVLWFWYVVPFGIPEISIPNAIGIDFLITFITMHQVDVKKVELHMRLANAILLPLAILSWGWAFHFFM